MVNYSIISQPEFWHWYSPLVLLIFPPLYKISFIYLFSERRERREKERERNINVWEIHRSVATRTPLTRDLHPQPRRVPWLGIEQVTFGFTGQHTVHWATLARAIFSPLDCTNLCVHAHTCVFWFIYNFVTLVDSCIDCNQDTEHFQHLEDSDLPFYYHTRLPLTFLPNPWHPLICPPFLKFCHLKSYISRCFSKVFCT